MEKNTLMFLDLVVGNNWERPIYFNNTSLQGISVNVNEYVVQEGNTYRLLPVKNPTPRIEFANVDLMYDNVMNKFQFRGLADPDVYNSVDHRNFALNHRSTFNSLANALIAQGDTERAREVLMKSLNEIADVSVPYDKTIAQSVGLLFEIGEDEKALEITKTMGERSIEVLAYFDRYGRTMESEIDDNLAILYQLSMTLKREQIDELASEYEEKFMMYYSKFNS
jgi:tetratricopeptide (TPR) repeat protein